MIKNTFYALFLMLFFASCGPKGGSGSAGESFLGTQWQLVGVDGYGYDVDPLMVVSSIKGDKSFVIFDRDSTFHGSGMCNAFKGNYTMDRKGNLKMVIDTTDQVVEFCEFLSMEDIMKESVNYVDHYKMEGDTLKLSDAFGKNLLIYVRHK